MNCPSCGAPMRAENDVFKCDYCHTILVPEKDDGVSVTTESDDDGCRSVRSRS